MSTDSDKLNKIARMALFDIPQTQIAKAVGVSDSRISQLVESDEYRNILAAISTEYFEQNQQLNDGWKSVEAYALTTVVEHLTWTKDADYALKAAMVANKAQRRGDIPKQPINGQAGVRAVLHLTANFIDKLQQFNHNRASTSVIVENGADENNEPKQKDADYMVPEAVEQLFVAPQVKVRKAEDLLNFFPDVNLVPAE